MTRDGHTGESGGGLATKQMMMITMIKMMMMITMIIIVMMMTKMTID